MKQRFSRWLWSAGVLLMVLGVSGFLVAFSGILPIKASSGHWGITEWFLQFAKRRSIATHTVVMDAPELEEPWLVLKGAGHYETGCRPCHGSPDLQNPRVVRAMTPRPPDLAPRIAEWEPEELFYIVKHGIKFTGMPAWPSQERDDEVRAMVAFLLALPKLDADDYQRLVHGEALPKGSAEPLPDLVQPAHVPRAVTLHCARCHGVDGRGRGVAAFPKLAGQRREYLFAALQAYARDERHSGIMQPIAAGLSHDESRDLADYYGSLPSDALVEQPGKSGLSPAHSAIDRGSEIASRGIPEQGIPSCKDCHGPGAGRRNAAYPTLAGQYADYLVLQLELFKTQQRGGSAYAHLMNHVATRLSSKQMHDVAQFYASLASPRESSQIR